MAVTSFVSDAIAEASLKPAYLIGIDGGTQSSKVSIFDLHGNVVCSAVQKLRPLHQPKPGVAEHPDDDLWDSIAAACRDALAVFPHAPSSIIGLGLCTIRCCQLALTENGELATPALSWMDTRVGDIYDWPNQNVQYLTTSSGYLTHRLTGETKDTAANYEGQWPLDKQRWQWSDDAGVLDHYRLQAENLFDLVLPGEVLGQVTATAAAYTGLPEGLPVVATANDKAVEALGAGLSGERTALISLGTYIGGMMCGTEYIAAPRDYFSNLACVPQRYLYESAGVRQGMGTVSWLRDLLGTSITEQISASDQGVKLSAEALLNQEALSVPAGCNGLVTVPDWLAPYDKAYKRGAILGLQAQHGRAHMYKSILESIALTMKNHVDKMSIELGRPVEKLILSGGGSNSDVFMQIFADVFGVTSCRNTINDAAGLGAAMCVAVAAGEVADFDAAVEQMVSFGAHFEPKASNVKVYQALNNDVFKNIRSHTDPIFKRIHSLQH